MTSPTQTMDQEQQRRHHKVNSINYQNNLASSYTETIDDLADHFDYAHNSDHYWSEPELSVLYGTPLYTAASPAQKLALNHLYWSAEYDQVAASEASTIQYNQVTAGVFDHLGNDYVTLCESLLHETEQERHHIHAFHKVAYKTKRALLGKALLGNDPKQFSKIAPRFSIGPFNVQPWVNALLRDPPYRPLRALTQTLAKSQVPSYCYSSYLQDLDQAGKVVPALTKGYFGVAIPPPTAALFQPQLGEHSFSGLSALFLSLRG